MIDHETIERQYQQMETHLADWAIARPDVRAVVIIGSRSRTNHPADGWSDLDAILFVDSTAVFAQPGDWRRALEAALGLPVWFAAFDLLDQGMPEWELVMEDGYKADLSFFPNQAPSGRQASLREMIAHAPFHNVFARGMRILVDKSPSGPLPDLPLRIPALPDQASFDDLIANTLLELTRAAKMARRGELWRAARTLDQEHQENLLKLLEFHARAGVGETGGTVKNTWAYGRFLEEWADPRAVQALPGTFAGSAWPSVRGAILASLDLLAWLGPETASRLGLVFPQQAVDQTGTWLREIVGE